MSRRSFLRSSAALLTAAGADWLLSGAAPAPHGPHEEAPAPFDYARLKGLARTRAAQPYLAPAKRLTPAI
ncbi:MAG TPA: hypothetical protein VL176_02480, partial [Steroidobacteraceae bacterium]|nr:hypothetical protein [Steroidobacteraceae bacterium]